MVVSVCSAWTVSQHFLKVQYSWWFATATGNTACLTQTKKMSSLATLVSAFWIDSLFFQLLLFRLPHCPRTACALLGQENASGKHNFLDKMLEEIKIKSNVVRFSNCHEIFIQSWGGGSLVARCRHCSYNHAAKAVTILNRLYAALLKGNFLLQRNGESISCSIWSEWQFYALYTYAIWPNIW